MLNQSCINWTLYWKVKKDTEFTSVTFNQESYQRAKKHYEQWGVGKYYFGMGSKYFQLAELGSILQGIDIIPDLQQGHHEVTKKQIAHDEKIKTCQEKRAETIHNIFYEAAKGALAPATLSKAPEGITSDDLGILLHKFDKISETVLGFEQAYDRIEYYKKLPFWERQYTYLTQGLGESLAGTTSADVDQLVEWISYWGTWGFVIGSLAFPAVGWISVTTMATAAAGKEVLFDVGLAYFQAAPLAFAELETVSGMYRDLLILYGIAYIGFYVEKVALNLLENETSRDALDNWTIRTDGLGDY
jgi:hypothetical protein